MTVQDDRRESEMRRLFELERDPLENRSGIDAHLTLRDMRIFFELKSTTDPRRSVTTVRDFSPDHIARWEGKHWLIGFYDPGGTQLLYSLYGSPRDMAPWINDRREYVAPDLKLAQRLPEAVTFDVLWEICGQKNWYSLTDAKRIHKRQYSATRYASLLDMTVIEDGQPVRGYSPDRMLDILRDRARYLILRGSTLNNPHIPGSYFVGWPRITESHAETLRQRVLEYLALGAKSGGESASDPVGGGRGDGVPDLAEDFVDAADEEP